MTGDQIFRIVTIVGMPASFVVLLVLVRICGCDKAPEKAASLPPRFGLIRKLVVLGFVVTFAALTLTGLGPNLVTGTRLADWLLMAHVGSGGAFIFFLLLAALLWADECRFRDGDEPSRFSEAMKYTFLGVVILGAVSALTMMVSMLPIFGPDGLEVLRDVHRYCALVYVAVALVHVVLAVRLRRGGAGA